MSDTSNNSNQQKPKTIQEYKLLLLKRVIEKRRLSLIKSKNMMFHN
jgi:hypothetical protein